MSMDFIKILSGIISEQIKDPVEPTRGDGSAESSSSDNSWSDEPSYSWTEGDKIGSPLKEPGECNHYHQYRPDRDYKYHNACDISTKMGTPLFAPHDGILDFKTADGSCGNKIEINGNDSEGKKVKSKFCHLSSINPIPSPERSIKKGDFIGRTGGQSGTPGAGRSDGAHLHWEFYVNGRPENPYTYN
jgi:murein DD-endopeptidase MepM/ murein hydrolase activator NlpD